MSEYMIIPTDSIDATADAIKAKLGSQTDLVWGQNGFADAVTAIATEIFWATYGTTTSAEIETAYQAGKTVLVIVTNAGEDYILILTKRASATDHRFGAAYAQSGVYLVGASCISDTWNSWNRGVASLASPAFTGTPTAPTAASGTNTTQIATTAFVQAALASDIPVTVDATYSADPLTITLDPCPKTYSFGEKAEIDATIDSTATQYHFSFTCPSGSATVLTMTGVTGIAGDTLAAGKTYEVDIWNGVALIMEVEATAT